MSELKNCPHKNFMIIDKQENYDVKDEQITVQSKVKKCTECNNEIFDIVLDTENLKKAYRIYKINHNLLQSEEILELRKKYYLTQNETHNTALVLLKNPENIKKIFSGSDNVSFKSMDLLENFYSGFKKFDVEKFIAAVLFFALNPSGLYKTKLMKLLWYADMFFFKETTVSITGMKLFIGNTNRFQCNIQCA